MKSDLITTEPRPACEAETAPKAYFGACWAGPAAASPSLRSGGI